MSAISARSSAKVGGTTRSGPARRAIGQMRTTLVYVDRASLLDELPSLLEEISDACATASEAVAAQHFGSIHSVQWKAEAG